MKLENRLAISSSLFIADWPAPSQKIGVTRLRFVTKTQRPSSSSGGGLPLVTYSKGSLNAGRAAAQ